MPKKRIFHIVTDDKFIDNLITQFDMFSQADNHYVVITRDSTQPFKIIKSKRVHNYTIKEFIKKVVLSKKCDTIFLHSFTAQAKRLAWLLPKRITLILFSWGGDMTIEKPYIVKVPNQLLPLTKAKYNKTLEYKKDLKYIVRYISFKLFQNLSLGRVNYYSGILPFEYYQVANKMFFKAKRLDFSYNRPMDKEKFMSDIHEIKEKNILIANSAYPTCNQLDIFPYLYKAKKKIGKVIVPLSYGIEKYKNIIVLEGKKQFGEQFMPLTEFMPYNEYSKLMGSCYIAIFGMMKQQSVGNIEIALRNGCKVFLWKNNPMYPFYKNLGLIIFSIDFDLENTLEKLEPLSIEEIKQNREIIYNRSFLSSKIRGQIEKIDLL